ncbi:pancreas transcription factor 1 subunit alpha-like [Tubulanus polymorphus]|uniref:pancreas transcription factor 1 subunit alpha-like n=1 Tax=Tubulanus polymorphus TaxID=672921 RepID=UPI003DA61CF1
MNILMQPQQQHHHQHHHHSSRILENSVWDGFFNDIMMDHASHAAVGAGIHHHQYGGVTAATGDSEFSSSSHCPSSPSSLPASPGSSGGDYSDAENNSLVGSPRKHHNSQLGRKCGGRQPVKRVQQRYAANMRERKRMKSINDAFEGLRTRIPLVRGDKKLSKVDTLRSAIDYIHELSQLLQTCGNGQFGQNSHERQKIIVRCQSTDMYDDYVPLYGHSLSWVNEDDPKYGPNNTLYAKTWTPEDPGRSETFD